MRWVSLELSAPRRVELKQGRFNIPCQFDSMGSQRSRKQRTFLLDASIWRYIADADAAEIIRQAATRKKIEYRSHPALSMRHYGRKMPFFAGSC